MIWAAVAIVWIAIGITIIDVAVKYQPAHLRDPNYKLLVWAVIAFWPFALTVLVCRKIFKRP